MLQVLSDFKGVLNILTTVKYYDELLRKVQIDRFSQNRVAQNIKNK